MCPTPKLPTLPVCPLVSKFLIKSPGWFWGFFLDILINDIFTMQRVQVIMTPLQ